MIVKRILDGRPHIILPDGGLTLHHFGYSENLAHAVLLSLDRPEHSRGQIYNAGDTNTLSESEWIRAIGAIVGWNGRIVSAPSDRLPKHLQSCLDTTQHLATDSTKIRTELGWEPRHSFETALGETVDWYLANREWCDRVRSGAYRDYYEQQYGSRLG